MHTVQRDYYVSLSNEMCGFSDSQGRNSEEKQSFENKEDLCPGW